MATKPNENTGLPCEFCGEKQRKLNVQLMPDGAMVVSISYQIPADKVKGEINALCKLLKGFVQ